MNKDILKKYKNKIIGSFIFNFEQQSVLFNIDSDFGYLYHSKDILKRLGTLTCDYAILVAEHIEESNVELLRGDVILFNISLVDSAEFEIVIDKVDLAILSKKKLREIEYAINSIINDMRIVNCSKNKSLVKQEIKEAKKYEFLFEKDSNNKFKYNDFSITDSYSATQQRIEVMSLINNEIDKAVLNLALRDLSLYEYNTISIDFSILDELIFDVNVKCCS